MNAIKKFLQDEEGAAAVECGLLVALIAVAVLTVVTAIGTNLKTVSIKLWLHLAEPPFN